MKRLSRSQSSQPDSQPLNSQSFLQLASHSVQEPVNVSTQWKGAEFCVLAFTTEAEVKQTQEVKGRKQEGNKSEVTSERSGQIDILRKGSE